MEISKAGLGGIMFGRCAALLAGGLLLSGYVSDGIGTDYAAISQKLGPPKAGQSRVVVLQEKRKGLSMALCACPAGRHQLVASEALFPGDTVREFATESGRTYFFLIRSSERHDSVTGVTMVAGLAGALVASAASAGSANPGPADFFPLDESTARTTLAELQLAQ
jgi:hypothetical protein